MVAFVCVSIPLNSNQFLSPNYVFAWCQNSLHVATYLFFTSLEGRCDNDSYLTDEPQSACGFPQALLGPTFQKPVLSGVLLGTPDALLHACLHDPDVGGC